MQVGGVAAITLRKDCKQPPQGNGEDGRKPPAENRMWDPPKAGEPQHPHTHTQSIFIATSLFCLVGERTFLHCKCCFPHGLAALMSRKYCFLDSGVLFLYSFTDFPIQKMHYGGVLLKKIYNYRFCGTIFATLFSSQDGLLQ